MIFCYKVTKQKKKVGKWGKKGPKRRRMVYSNYLMLLVCLDTNLPICLSSFSISAIWASQMEMETVPGGNSPASTTSTTSTAATPAVPSPAAPSSKLSQLTESLKLEHQFLRVPFEHYKKTIRSNHRIVEKEISAVISGVGDATDSDLSGDEAAQRLNSLVSRLQGLKRKVSVWNSLIRYWLRSWYMKTLWWKDIIHNIYALVVGM